jgi:exosome complex RNA-binding protein Rrp42 (RNase PH superfamily)
MEKAEDGMELQPKMVNGQPAKKRLELQHCPLSASVAVYKGKVIVDPTRQEEEIIGSTTTVIASNVLHGVNPGASPSCTSAAELQYMLQHSVLPSLWPMFARICAGRIPA